MSQRDDERESWLAALAELNNELVSRQRELARSHAALAHAAREKDELLGTVAHDLRTPLSVISTLSAVLSDGNDPPLTDAQREIAEVIRRSAISMQRLVEDLLELSVVENGAVRLLFAPLSLDAALADQVRMLRPLGQRRAVTIALSATPLMVRGDREKLGQVANNLVANALKYSPEGGEVLVRLVREGPFAHVSVRDHGPGIPADEIGRLFSPFGRSSVPAFDERERSTGLGLSIARKIVEAHGGHVGVESVVGRGATFYFTVPVHDAPPAP